MPAPDLVFLDATELAQLLAAREVSAREVMAAHLAQVERVNPTVNAIVTLVAEQAMAEAARADERLARGEPVGPLHGLPVAHKDLFATRGIRTTQGSPIFADTIPAEDAPIVARANAAGAITIGKTNTPEFGLGSQTFNQVFGRTLNPYELTKTCGGSSGGAAVALACGMVPLADGSDTGGSLRNPANFCNVVGLRPCPGRVPSTAGAWQTIGVSGPMGRSVRDVALFLSVLAGPHPDSPLSISESPERFAAPLDRDLRGLRIAYSQDLGGLPVDPAVREVIASVPAVLEGLGCLVEEGTPDLSGAEHVFQTLRAIHLASALGGLLGRHRERMKATAIWNIEKGFALTGEEVARAERLRSEIFVRMCAFMRNYDALICPVNQVPPFDATIEYPEEIAGVPMENYIDWMRSCWYITVTAHPAISVPAGFTKHGLPVGVQIVGRYRDEFGLLQIARAFEQATGHGQKRPPVAV